MQTVAKFVAEQLLAEYGSSALSRAMSLSEATGLYGSAECAAFYGAVAEIIGDTNRLAAVWPAPAERQFWCDQRHARPEIPS